MKRNKEGKKLNEHNYETRRDRKKYIKIKKLKKIGRSILNLTRFAPSNEFFTRFSFLFFYISNRRNEKRLSWITSSHRGLTFLSFFFIFLNLFSFVVFLYFILSLNHHWTTLSLVFFLFLFLFFLFFLFTSFALPPWIRMSDEWQNGAELLENTSTIYYAL